MKRSISLHMHASDFPRDSRQSRMASDITIVFNFKMLTCQRATPDRPVGVSVIALSQSLADKPACNTCYTCVEVPYARGRDKWIKFSVAGILAANR